MSSPQLEDGFLRIANELIEAILGFGFSHREVLVLFTIIRKTYGYGKKTDDISASQIGDMCKIARPHVTSTLNALASRNVISKQSGRFGSIIGIQKNHKKWVSVSQIYAILPSTELVHHSTESVHVPNQYTPSTDSVQVDSTESVHTKENLPKENQQKKTSCASQAKREGLDDRFSRFYKAYPLKKSKHVAYKSFAKLNPDEQLLTEMLSGIERAKKSEQWRSRKFIPHPATWLNAGGWQDEIDSEYADPERAVIQAFNDALGEQLGIIDEAIFAESRAGAIRDFLTLSQKPNFHLTYFSFIRDRCELPPHVGFDWLLERETFTKIKGGQHEKGSRP